MTREHQPSSRDSFHRRLPGQSDREESLCRDWCRRQGVILEDPALRLQHYLLREANEVCLARETVPDLTVQASFKGKLKQENSKLGEIIAGRIKGLGMVRRSVVMTNRSYRSSRSYCFRASSQPVPRE